MRRAETYNIVYPVLAGGVAIRIEVAIGCTVISLVITANTTFTSTYGNCCKNRQQCQF